MKDSARTTAVVLVAGRGSRLNSVNPDRPKCLAQVNGVSILERMFAALELAGTGDAVLVVGYEHAAIEEAVDLLRPSLPVRFVRNPGYLSSGTCRSLLLGLSAVDAPSDVAIIEGDVVFQPAILAAAVSNAGLATTVLARWGPEHSGSCAVVEDGLVRAWVHESRRPAGFSASRHCKTVNITWLSSTVWREGLIPALEKVLSEDGESAPVEYAFDRLVRRSAYPIRALPADSWKWWEIDTPDDLRLAAEIFN